MAEVKRRPPGEVRNAIIDVMSKARGDMAISDIHAGVKELLGDVPASSVRSYLRLNTGGSSSLFTRTGHGRYRLRRGVGR